MTSDLSGLFGGSVELEVSGGGTEKFLNYAMREGVQPRNIQRLADGSLSMRVSLREVRRLRPAARATHCRIHIKRRRGLPFLAAFLRRRPVILFALPLAALLLTYVASLIFSVQVTSPYALSEEDIQKVEALAEQAGIRPGASRWRIDLEQAEQAILAGFPEIYYAEIFEHGTHLEISVVKRIDIPEEERQLPPGAVVAAADGVIREVLVRRGTAVVKSGDTVKKGDVLIQGRLGNDWVAADGIVTASVYGEGYGEWALTQTEERETGNSVDGVAVRLEDGRTLHVAGAAETPYALSELHADSEAMRLWRIIPLPVEIIYSQFRELEQYTLHFGEQEAAELARMLAGRNAESMAATLVGREKIKDTEIVVEDIDLGDGIKRARAVAVALADIGSFQAYSEDTADGITLP